MVDVNTIAAYLGGPGDQGVHLMQFCILQINREPVKLLQWLCHDDSTINIVMSITTICQLSVWFYMRLSHYPVWLFRATVQSTLRNWSRMVRRERSLHPHQRNIRRWRKKRRRRQRLESEFEYCRVSVLSTSELVPGLADFNQCDLNQWFKSRFKSIFWSKNQVILNHTYFCIFSFIML